MHPPESISGVRWSPSLPYRRQPTERQDLRQRELPGWPGSTIWSTAAAWRSYNGFIVDESSARGLVHTVPIDECNKLVGKVEVLLRRLMSVAAHHALQLPFRNAHHVIGVFGIVCVLEWLRVLVRKSEARLPIGRCRPVWRRGERVPRGFPRGVRNRQSGCCSARWLCRAGYSPGSAVAL